MTVAVGLGVALAFGTQLAGLTLAEQVRSAAAAGAGRADYEVLALAEEGFGPLVLEQLRALPEVAVVAPRIERRVLEDDGARTRLVTVWGIEPQAERQLDRLPLRGGAWPDAAAAEVALSAGWAARDGLRLGDTVGLLTAAGHRRFIIRGLVGDDVVGEGSWGRRLYVSTAAARAWIEPVGRLTQISVQLAPGVRPDTFPPRLGRAMTESYVLRDDHAFAAGRQDAQLEVSPLLFLTAAVALFVSFFLVLNAFLVNVAQRRREIGLLRAAGATRRQIRGVVLLQAWSVGLLGSVVGCALGLGVAAALARWVLAVPFQVGPNRSILTAAATSITLGLAVATLAGFLPALQASRVAPLLAVRPGRGLREGPGRARATGLGLALAVGAVPLLLGDIHGYAVASLGVVVFLAGLAFLLPRLLLPLAAVARLPFGLFWRAEAWLAHQQLLRWPRRSVATIGGIVVTVAMLSGLGGLGLAVQAASDRWISSLFVAEDLVIAPAVQPDTVLEPLRSLPGVRAVSPIRFFTAGTAGQALTLAAITPEDYRDARALEFVAGAPARAWEQLRAGPSLLLSSRLAGQLGLRPDDAVELQRGEQRARFQVAGVVAHTLPASGGEDAALVGRASAQAVFGIEGFQTAQVIPDGPVTPAWRTRLHEAAAASGMETTTVAAIAEQARARISPILRGVELLTLTAMLLGIFAAANSVLMNIQAGRREMALLRAIGMTRTQVQRMVLAEAGMISLMGCAAGLLAGAFLSLALIRATRGPGFQPPYLFPLGPALLGLLAVVGGTVLAALLPARRAARRGIVHAVRYE
jgi:putative ABC transport system permease protein